MSEAGPSSVLLLFTDGFLPAGLLPGNVKKGSGIQGECNWEAYLQFMKNQLTEILTNYGPSMVSGSMATGSGEAA